MLDNQGRSPIIIIGMHRSGTSMITNMLRELGLFIGWELESNNEAIFFLERNEKILNACNGSWDNPMVIEYLINHSEMEDKVTDRLIKELSSFQILSYLGPKLYLKYKSVFKLDFPWGWKDPRNTVLLPLWLNIFPRAKIIHIYRNGIDVAQSLATREERRINKIVQGHAGNSQIAINQVNPIKDKGLSLYIMAKLRALKRRIASSKNWNDFGVRPFISIETGFEIWNTYLTKAFEHTQNKTNQIINVKYEDFIDQSEHHLRNLMEFCDLAAHENEIKSIASSVVRDRKYRYKNNKIAKKFFISVKDTYWMNKLGYNNQEMSNSD